MPSSVMLPLLAHAKAVVLSVPSSVCSRGCMRGDLRRNCVTCAASSSTLMEMSPWGLSHVRTRARISGGSAHCQTWAAPCRSKKTPPSAYVQASDAPNHVGALGNSARRCVGRACIVWKKCRQRRSVTAAPREMRTRPPGRGARPSARRAGPTRGSRGAGAGGAVGEQRRDAVAASVDWTRCGCGTPCQVPKTPWRPSHAPGTAQWPRHGVPRATHASRKPHGSGQKAFW